jgi:ribonuclease P protein component
MCGQPAQSRNGVLILALGRAAGPAVARSRIRRIAREVLGDRCCPPEALDLLLLVRSQVTQRPRRQVRASLEELLERLSIALTRRALSGRDHE